MKEGLLPDGTGEEFSESDLSHMSYGSQDEEMLEDQSPAAEQKPALKNPQSYYGGLPMSNTHTDFVSEMHPVPVVKKFNTEQFLDKFFQQSALPKAQPSLAEELGIQSAAQISYDLSVRGGLCFPQVA